MVLVLIPEMSTVSLSAINVILTLGKLCWAAIQGLLKQVSGSLQLLAPIAVYELGEIGVPDVIHVGPSKESDATLICLKNTTPIYYKKNRFELVDILEGQGLF